MTSSGSRSISQGSQLRFRALVMGLRTVGILAAGLGFVSVPHEAEAVSLSGTVFYTGTHGPVSSNRSILIRLHADPFLQNPLGPAVLITTNGGSFDFSVPAAGDYFLVSALDVIPDGKLDVGEPFQIYNNRFTLPGDAIHVPQSGLTGLSLAFDDTGQASGIAGTATYTGTLGQVSEVHPLVIERFLDPDLTVQPNDGFKNSVSVGSNSGPYQFIIFLNASTHYLRAFLDLNGNGMLDPDEPFEIYQNKRSGAGDPAVAGPSQTSVNFTFGDSTGFPIATTAAPESTVSAAFDGSNFLVGIQTQTTVGAQLVSPSGVALGPLITTNRSGVGPVLGFNGTNYLLAWATLDASPFAYGQLVSPSGTTVGFPFQISQSNTVIPEGFVGGIASDGTNYLVVWIDSRLSPDSYIYGRLVAASGSPVRSDILISESPGKEAEVGFDGTNYLVVWHGGGSNRPTVMGRFIDRAGAPASAEFIVNASPAPSDNPGAIVFGGTNYLVVWPDEVEGSGEGQFFGQLVTPSGALAGGVILITTARRPRLPSAAFDGANYLVTWTDFPCGDPTATCAAVYGQYLSRCGALIGSPFPIAAGPGNQMFSTTTFGAGQYLVTWNSNATLGPSGLIGGDVYGTFLAPAPLACTGDCGRDAQVTVDELLTMVNIALGNTTVCACEAADAGSDGQITIDEILTAVNNALNGC
jgi:hypothetical protein